MQNPLTLRNADLVCDLKPELGGCIAGLWFSGIPVLRSTPAHELHSVRQAGSYPLVPFSNRVSQATLQWQGTDHPLVQNWAPDPHAIHGVGWERPWAVLEASDTFALLAYEHKADASWPFDFDCSQAFKLEANALELSLSITNQSALAVPVGLGWHPFFVKRPDSHIQFDATGRWEMGHDKLPTYRAPSTGISAPCTTLDVDHCFDGWAGAVQLRDSVLAIRVTSGLSRLVVYSTPTSDSIAIEPVSHVNNAVNRMAQTGASAEDLGVCILQAGQTFSSAMRIEVEHA
ncbi:aldose 1-epimerase [Rhodoferax sp. AJA081-3]|uniref:aldose 1-epimerase n=1 Tax=Rhodoferax sp. AJA081-3 TaxID=2752316 RepID=UPI001ADFA4B0|nr:aldose 1-epimerase [Rhodoferax sp. AJA081-3]QTN26512.1 aldose 1-epimerase [Rhodoferax sp. AJA081-3]